MGNGVKRLVTGLLILVLTLVPVDTFAVSASFLDFMARNNIFYFLPSDYYENNCLPGVGNYDGIASAGLSGQRSAFVDKYHDIAAELGSQYGIPWEAVMAQGILESVSGTSRFAVERNNFFGIGAVDSNPNNAHTFSSAAEGWKGYFEFISNNPRYRKNGAFDHAGDPIGYIESIKAAGYATDSNYVTKLVPIIKAIQNRAEEKGWALSSDSVQDVSYAGLSSYEVCSSTTGGNGDLNATALALSWADRGHGINDPNSAYREALAAVGLNSHSDKYVQMGASCDAFVATVLRYSGVDPDVPCCGASNMLNYFASHPEKYQEIPNIGNSSNMQPGDIRASASHVEMYVSDESGVGRIASASHGDRTADHSRGYYANDGMRIFRAI
ncbi:glucosaminidase domain-containing protein [Candidatus Saccharibacteria bacterium]|nr:glucosaminidase domain-containing protein [Candidatus Saccharibacteria bacterium]